MGGGSEWGFRENETFQHSLSFVSVVVLEVCLEEFNLFMAVLIRDWWLEVLKLCGISG